jgi:hypothetical protein
MPTKDAVISLLGHPVTREVARRVGQGHDPRVIASEMAADALRKQMMTALGLAPGGEPEKPKPWTHDGMVDAKGDPIDADYVVIDVTPGVKHRKKVG